MIVVFSKSGVPLNFGKCPDVDYFNKHLHQMNFKQDLVSIPAGKVGLELVDIMAKATYPNGDTISHLPQINIHSGTPSQKQEISDKVVEWYQLFGQPINISFYELNDIEFEYKMSKAYQKKILANSPDYW